MPALNPIPARALGAAALAVALTACGGQSSEPAAAEAPATLQWDPEDQELTIDEAQAMVSSFEEEIGAPLAELQLESLSLSPNGGLDAKAMDPKAPTELNGYTINIYTDRNDVTPYDYGGAERFEDLQATLFSGSEVTAQTFVDAYNDSFNRVTGDKAELRGSGPTIARDNRGALELYVVNGTERDRQSVYYAPSGEFLRVD